MCVMCNVYVGNWEGKGLLGEGWGWENACRRFGGEPGNFLRLGLDGRRHDTQTEKGACTSRARKFLPPYDISLNVEHCAAPFGVKDTTFAVELYTQFNIDACKCCRRGKLGGKHDGTFVS